MKTNWITLSGVATVSESGISFLGKGEAKKGKSGKLTQDSPTSFARSSVYFESGDISADVYLEESNSKVQFILKLLGGASLHVGFNTQSAAYGIVRGSGGTFSPLCLSGDETKPKSGEWISLRVRVRGSQVDLFVSDVCVASASASIAREQIEIVFKGFGKIEVRNITIRQKRPIVFAVMQFTEEYNALYEDVISPICESYGYEVVRADDIHTSGLIIGDIISSIKGSSLVIADITPNNLNVFYEVGFAHGIGKTTILLSDRNRDKLPFDISGYRLLFYDNTIGGKAAVESALKKHLDAIRA